jgi:transcriptional regulator with XRE-family HTH domain
MGKLGVKQRKHEAAIARMLGITRMTLNRYRRGMREMPLEQAVELELLDRRFDAIDRRQSAHEGNGKPAHRPKHRDSKVGGGRNALTRRNTKGR